MVEHWPFESPPNEATIIVRPIMDGKKPILLAAREAEDGSWSFLTGEEFQLSDGMVVGLRRVVALDPSVSELADLRFGWSARRERVGAPWVRALEEE